MNTVEITDSAQWDAMINAHTYGHPLQLWGWGELKRTGGWWPYRIAVYDGQELVGAAQILMLAIPGMRRRVAYVPRGPVLDPAHAKATPALQQIAQYARSQRALFLTLEPAWREFSFEKRWHKSRQHILLAETYVIDLTKSEAALQEAMRHKTRQYIRKSEAMGVQIIKDTAGEKFDDFWRIYSETAKRAKFSLHGREYYRKLLSELGDNNQVYFALVDGKPEAFLWLATGGKVAFELYGGVTTVGAEHKANFGLKWRAIQDMKTAGLAQYDFNGRLNDGVSQFKVGFGPDEVTFVGSFDLPFSRGRYELWHRVLPIAKQVGRRVPFRRRSSQ